MPSPEQHDHNNPFLMLPPELFLLIATSITAEDLASLIVSTRELSRTYVPLLSTHVCSTGETLLTGSILKRYHSLSHSLLAHGAKPDPADTERGWTPLHHAARRGDLAAIQLLLHFGANPDARADGNLVPLHIASAAIADHSAVVPLFASFGADINARTDAGATPIYFAASRGRVEIVKALLDNGAGYGFTDDEGWAPMHCAAVKGYAEVIRVLADAGAPVDLGDRAGLTPLMYAALRGNVGAVRMLLEKGAEVDRGDGRGGVSELRAIYGAANTGCVEVVRVLLEAGASRALGDAVFAAGAMGHAEVVKMLVESGREGVMRRVGELLPHAMDRERIEVIDVLLDAGVVEEERLLELAIRRGHNKIATLLRGRVERGGVMEMGEKPPI